MKKKKTQGVWESVPGTMMDKGKEKGKLGQGSIFWHKIQTEGVSGRQKRGLLEDNVRNK